MYTPMKVFVFILSIVQIVSIPTFSSEWIGGFGESTAGCIGVEKYSWQGCGIGYNMNSMLNAWLYSMVVGNHEDFSVIIGEGMFDYLECSEESNGLANRGWECLFGEIPHLCMFGSSENWTDHLVSENVSEEVILKSESIKINAIKRSHALIQENLGDIDHITALSVLADYVWSHMTPWLKNDAKLVAGDNELFNGGSPYLGLHIRRGDKVSTGEAESTPVDVYMQTASAYLDENTIDVEGIWVASDEVGILEEVRDLSEIYFPHISRENIVYNSGKKEVITRSKWQGYSSFVTLVSDMNKLANSEVFVGSFSSNLGRLVTVFREGKGKPRDSSMSVDVKTWFSG